MKKLGVAVTKTRDGLLIVKSSIRDPRKLVGSLVYDKNMTRIGKIVDVIGRVDEPYVVVKPESREVLDMIELGPVYYYVERKKKPFRGRKKGKKRRGKKGRGRK